MHLPGKILLGTVAALGSAFTFASYSIWVKYAYNYLQPWELLSLQSLLASALLLLVNLHQGWKDLKLPLQTLRQLVLLGLVGTMLSNICFTWSIRYLSPAMATILLYTYPALVILGSTFWLKKKVTNYHWLAVALTFLGSYLSVNTLDNGTFNLLGIALALGSAICTAFYNLQGERVLTVVSPLAALTISQFASTAALFFIAPPRYLWSGGLPWPGVLLALGTTIVASLIPFFLLLKGIALLGAGPISIISACELPIVAIYSFLFFNQKLSFYQLSGLLLVISAILVIHWSERHQTGNTKENSVP